ncbi:MAG TPA: FtsX-like permease family protein [Acidimicrobiales bacterium]|nr:FtsX-like permease family protein [Acidimicrobiales bacterium]
MRFTTARVGARLARRELRRRPWRTALVLLMVVLPTGTMAAVATYARTAEWSASDRVAAEHGTVDAIAHLPAGPEDRFEPYEPEVTEQALADLRGGLPSGSRVLVERSMSDRVRDGDRRSYFELTDVDLADPLHDGRYVERRGELPTGDDEAVVSRSVAESLDLDVGDRITPDRLGRTLTVVGTVRAARSEQDLVIVAGPLDVDASGWTSVWVDLPGRPYEGVLTGPARPTPVLRPIAGWNLSPVTAWLEPDSSATVYWTYVGGGVGLAVLGTVIAAAFAVGARRQLRTIGLLSATGASPGAVRWFLVLQGITAGLVGSIVGVGVGVSVAHATPRELLESMAGHVVDGADTNVLDLVPIVLIGTIAAAVAAWLPARSVATVPTLQALAGRRPLGEVPARVPVIGALSILGGCALFAMSVAGTRGSSSSLWALVAVAGGLACLFGSLAIAPWVVAGVERVSARLSGSLRLAGRSIGRSRVRSSAVVGAICAVAAVVLGGSTLVGSLDADDGSTTTCCAHDIPYVTEEQVVVQSSRVTVLSDDPESWRETTEGVLLDASLVSAIGEILPDAQVAAVADLRRAGSTGDIAPTASFDPPQMLPGTNRFVYAEGLRIGVADEALLDVFGVPSDLRDALQRGEAVSVVEPRHEPTGVRLSLPPRSTVPDEEAAFDDGVALPLGGSFHSEQASSELPQVLVSAATARSLDLEIRPAMATVFAVSSPISDAQLDRLQLLQGDVGWEEQFRRNDRTYESTWLTVPPERPVVSPAMAKAAAMVAALLLVLALVAVGLALAARDSQDEREVLVAVGAPPTVLRRVGALRAVVLVAAAVLVAVPTGLVPAAAIVAADQANHDLRIDLWFLAFVVLALPVLVGVVAFAGGALRDRLRPARPDVFAFSD